MYRRHLSFAIDLEWVRVHFPLADFAGAADAVSGLAARDSGN
jgi:hypothetical protein